MKTWKDIRRITFCEVEKDVAPKIHIFDLAFFPQLLMNDSPRESFPIA